MGTFALFSLDTRDYLYQSSIFEDGRGDHVDIERQVGGGASPIFSY